MPTETVHHLVQRFTSYNSDFPYTELRGWQWFLEDSLHPLHAEASLSNFQMQQFDQKDSRGEAAPRTPILWRSGGALDKVDKLVNCNIYIYGYRYRGFMGCLCFWIFLDAYGCLWMFMDVYGMVGIASNPPKSAQKCVQMVCLWYFPHIFPVSQL